MMGPGTIATPGGMSVTGSLGGMVVLAVFVGLPAYGLPFALLCVPWTLARRREGDWDAVRAALRSATLSVPVSVALCVPLTILSSYTGSPLMRGVALACPLVAAAALCSSLVFRWGLRTPEALASAAGKPSPRPDARSLALFSLSIWTIPLVLGLVAAMRA